MAVPKKNPRYSYRKYQKGDAIAINELYKRVTGIERSEDEFSWQWLSAPAGPAEIWLIEYLNDEGVTELIGHHGIMPFVFSDGDKDLIAGKTENTMVLPAFRRKILYPKFERIFLKEYIHRFDLLFSTIGPAPALRQREAMGYSSKENWVFYDWGLVRGAKFAKIVYSLSQRREKGVHLSLLKGCLEIVLRCLELFSHREKRNFPMICVLNSLEAKRHSFFEKFWIDSRSKYGITPRRFREDLAWRFWDNPYGNYITIIFNQDTDRQAFAIILKRTQTIYVVEDLVCTNPDAQLYAELIETLGEWVAQQRGMVLRFSTTTDNKVGIEAFKKVKFLNLLDVYPFSKNIDPDKKMLRKACQEEDGLAAQDLESWYVTPHLFEGR